MKMLTRCPECATAFRVYAEQLSARDGHVRCGRCSTVFDASSTLELEIDLGPPDPAVEAKTTGMNTATFAARDELAAVEPTSTGSRLERATRLPEAALEKVRAMSTRAITPREDPSDEGESAFGFGPDRGHRDQRATLLWGAAIAAMLLVFVIQAMYTWRSDLAAHFGLRPLLEGACRVFGCVIPLPRRAEFITIESSDLAPERGAAGVLTLSGVLRNRAGFTQAHPALELTLTDMQDRPLARRVLLSNEYLNDDVVREAAFPAASEASFKVYIEAASLNASGFRLNVFFP
jgi:predicted Zn finger-like uncharacterized protein